jgi:hypothetical protein
MWCTRECSKEGNFFLPRQYCVSYFGFVLSHVLLAILLDGAPVTIEKLLELKNTTFGLRRPIVSVLIIQFFTTGI